ncbi:MAG TPA: hypothetical protein VMF62_19815 [Acetobacteraceae bacterium]|nr:hypothetical protein [Acetobacteraceae bacterium]
MPAVAVKPYAQKHGIPPSTLFKAIRDGHLARDARGKLDEGEADAWREGYSARGQRVTAAAATREQMLTAQAIGAAAQIGRLRRELTDLRESTAPRAVAEAARSRRLQRLEAALAALPGWGTPAAAEALQRPKKAVRKALQLFVGRLAAELALDAEAAAGTGALLKRGAP